MKFIIAFLFAVVSTAVAAQCTNVTGLSATSVTSSSVTISFTTPSASTFFVIKYNGARQNINDPGGPYPKLVTASLNTLSASTAYTVSVVRYCTVTDSTETSTVSFTTPAGSCDTVTNMVVTSTNSTATISSLESPYGSSYQLKYVKIGYTDTVTATGATADFSLAGLRPSSTYYYKITTACPSGTAATGWRTFVTQSVINYTNLPGYGSQVERFIAFKHLGFPQGAGAPTTPPNGRNDWPGQYMDTLNQIMYFFDPRSQAWFTSSGDEIGYVDNVTQMEAYTKFKKVLFNRDPYRGGRFNLVFSSTALTIDSGVVFKANGLGSNYYWQRDVTGAKGINVWWFGAVPDSTVNSAPAFDRWATYLGKQLSSSLQNGRTINQSFGEIPAGSYWYQGDGIGAKMGGNFNIFGSGTGQTRLLLDMPGKYFIDDSVNTIGFSFRSLQFNPKGGSSYAGVYRNRRTSNIAGNTIYYKKFIDCSFFGHSVCAISSNSKDDPFYMIDNCKFRGLNTSKGVMLPGGGGSTIQNSWFDGGSGFIHLRGASGMTIAHNSFNGVHTPSRGWKFDIWIEPNYDTSGIFPNAENLVIRDNIHGNENDQTNDVMYLIAISDTTTNGSHTTAPDYGSYWPLLSQVDKVAYKIRNMSIYDEKLSTDAGLYAGIVTSYTENLGNCYIGRLKMDCSNRYIVEFPGLTAFDYRASYASTNYIDLSNNSYSVSLRYLSNVPGFGRVYDPQNSLRGTYAAVPALGQSYDYDYRDLINVGITSPSATVAITGGQTSIDGKTNATALRLNQPEGVVYYGVDTTGLIPGRPVWVEFDIAAGADSSLKEVSVRLADNYTQSVAQRWQIEVPPASEGWRTVRLQHIWYERTGSSGLKLFFGGGSLEPVNNIKYKIGRVRVYTARTPQIFPDAYWVMKDTTAFDRFVVSAGDFKRTMTKAAVVADLGIADYRPKTGSVSGSNFTTTSTSAVDVTGLSVPVLANKKYKIVVTLFTSCSGTNGIFFGVNGPSGSATLSGQWVMTTTSSTAFAPNRLGSIGALNATAANRFASGGSATLIGFLTTGSNAGNVTVQVASANGAETSTIVTGSTMEITENQ